MVDRVGGTITVDASVRMWHTVLQMGHDKEPCGVSITNNPLEYERERVFAQLVCHKTRSMNCAVQVARYVRRRYELEGSVSVHRSARIVEARIGYVCLGGYQYGPEHISSAYSEMVAHVAATSIAQLLRESAGGINGSRTRYTVYEVRGFKDGAPFRFRACTNKMHAVEQWWRLHPADQIARADVVHVGRYETREEAERNGPLVDPDQFWTRRPPAEYMRRFLRIDEHGAIVWTATGEAAVRHYDRVTSPVVCVGPHVYTENHVRYVLEKGEWFDGQIRSAPDGSLLHYPA